MQCHLFFILWKTWGLFASRNVNIPTYMFVYHTDQKLMYKEKLGFFGWLDGCQWNQHRGWQISEAWFLEDTMKRVEDGKVWILCTKLFFLLLLHCNLQVLNLILQLQQLYLPIDFGWKNIPYGTMTCLSGHEHFVVKWVVFWVSIKSARLIFHRTFIWHGGYLKGLLTY